MIQNLLRLEMNIFDPLSEQVEVQIQKMDPVDFSNNLMFGNPKSQTIMAKETNKNIDLFQVISNLAGKRFGITIKPEQLKS